MKINSLPNQRWCVVENRRGRSIAEIRRSILRHENVNDRFTLPATPAPARDQTLFKAYRSGDELLIVVGVFESVGPTLRHGTSPSPNRNSIELHFAPWNDELGWVQFCFAPDGAVQTFNHFPYPDAASTSFARPELKESKWETDSSAQTHRLYWLSAKFSVGDMFRSGDVCGFNVVRYALPIEEWSSWNHASAVGFQDATTYGKLSLRRPRKAEMTPLRIRRAPSAKTARDFRLSMTYDIPDNIGCSSGYTPERIERELAVWKSSGIDRIYWIEYGPISEWPSLFKPNFFYMTGAQRTAFLRNVALTKRTCDDTLRFAVKSAKKLGLEIFAVYKPFDQGFNFAQTKNDGRSCVKEIENRYAVAHPDIAAHPELTMCAHPHWTRRAVFPITRIRLWSEVRNDSFNASRLTIWTSADNRTFTKYRGKIGLRVGAAERPHYRWTPAGKVAERSKSKNWRIELFGLKINAPFVAIEIKGKTFSLSHRQFAFAEATGADGNEAPVDLSSAGNRSKGYLFNKTWAGWANHTEPILDTYTWPGAELGLRFGDAENITTIFEPTSPQARQIWLSHVRRILNAGVDGIDIRTIGHHNAAESFLKFAFAEPVRNEFRQRFGRDVTANEADYVRVRHIRGEAYTQFIKEASSLVHARGKKLAAHIEWGTEVPSHLHTRLQMQMTLEWQRWIREEMVDEISLRGWGALNRHVHSNILPLAHRHNVGVHIVSTNLAGGMDLRAMELCPRLCAEAQSAGFAGYNLYESDSLLRMNAQGFPMSVGLVDEAVRQARASIDR